MKTAFNKNYSNEIDPNSRDRAQADSDVHLRRSIERLKLFAGVTKFGSKQDALYSLYSFKDVFINSQFQELREYYRGTK